MSVVTGKKSSFQVDKKRGKEGKLREIVRAHRRRFQARFVLRKLQIEKKHASAGTISR
jgi:hypothetical protein